MDPHIFADPDPDPGGQNLADPTDPDPKHCFLTNFSAGFIRVNMLMVETTKSKSLPGQCVL